MRSLLIANPPPEIFFPGLLIGLMIVAGIVVVFIARTARWTRQRLLRLCVLALVLGPLIGVGVALPVLLGEDPSDRWSVTFSLIIVGTVAGVASAIVMGFIGVAMGRGCSTQHEHDDTAGSPPDDPGSVESGNHPDKPL
jgi:hypothetical protein